MCSAKLPADEQQSYPMASLYVTNLHPDVTEVTIYEKFSQFGPVLSIRVCRDMTNRKSLGYGYVNFEQAQDAERALDTMNFDVMKGRAIRIMWSQKDPTLRKSGVGNIFIKNLHKSFGQKEFYDTFTVFGNILSCKIATDETGKYGFVHFETEEAAVAAISKINGMMINGKKVFVGKFIPKVERSDDGEEIRFTNVFVKNFGQELDDNKLMELFQEYGEITSAKVMTDDSGKCRGFGFVCFKDPEAADAAVNALNGYEFTGRALFCGRSQKNAERQRDLRSRFEKQRMERTARYAAGVNLYVKNLDDSLDDDRLKKEFAVFGNITSAKVMTDHTARSKGFGFVCFSNPEEATKAVTEMNGKIVSTKPLYVALAQRKEDRRQHLASQYMQRMTTRFPNSMGPMQMLMTPTMANYMMQQVPRNQQAFLPQMQRATQRPIIGNQPNAGPISQQGQTRSLASVVAAGPPGQAKPTGVPDNDTITTSMLAAVNPQEQKQILGERLYPLVCEMHNELAGQITRMLLEIDNAELLHMLESRESLKAKADEAMAVLQTHQSKGNNRTKPGNKASSDDKNSLKTKMSMNANTNLYLQPSNYEESDEDHSNQSNESKRQESSSDDDDEDPFDQNRESECQEYSDDDKDPSDQNRESECQGYSDDDKDPSDQNRESEFQEYSNDDDIIVECNKLSEPDENEKLLISEDTQKIESLRLRLYPLVQQSLLNLADSVTESLIWGDNDEELLRSKELLTFKINEIVTNTEYLQPKFFNEIIFNEENKKRFRNEFRNLFLKVPSDDFIVNKFE